MTSRRSFLKAMALAAGGATIASKAVSDILTRPEHKNEPRSVPDTQNGHPDKHSWTEGDVVHTYCKENDGSVTHCEHIAAYVNAGYEPCYRIHPDIDPEDWHSIEERFLRK